jgi:hypothetical protein
MAAQAGWDPRKCDVEAAEVWLDDAYDNITFAQACMTARREREEEWHAAMRESPEPPDGETSAEKARRLWILRALQLTSYVSHRAWEICDDTSKADWTHQTYREYRRLLDEEMMAVCQIYAEVALADLPVREGKEARGMVDKRAQGCRMRARAHRHAHQKIRRAQGAPIPCQEGLTT